MSFVNPFSYQEPIFVVMLINTPFSCQGSKWIELGYTRVNGDKILYLHMVCCRQSNSVQQWARCWTGCWAGCRTGSGAGLRGSSFSMSVLHGRLAAVFLVRSLLYRCTSSLHIKPRGGVGHRCSWQFLHFCFCLSSSDHGLLFIQHRLFFISGITNYCLLNNGEQ